jgi:hypothetical protein
LNDMYLFSLFDDSNFDGYDKQRFPELLEAGLGEHGLEPEDVLAVTHGFNLWAICKEGIFQVGLRGVLKKRTEVERLIPYTEILEVRVEEIFRPKGAKLALYDNSEAKCAQIEFTPNGGRFSTTTEDELAQCRRVLQIMEGAWRLAGGDQ